MSALTVVFGYGAQPLTRSPSSAFCAGLVGSCSLSLTLATKLAPLSSSPIKLTSFTVKVPVVPAGALRAIVFGPCASHCGLISSICVDQLACEGKMNPPCAGLPLTERSACTQEDKPNTW